MDDEVFHKEFRLFIHNAVVGINDMKPTQRKLFFDMLIKEFCMKCGKNISCRSCKCEVLNER